MERYEACFFNQLFGASRDWTTGVGEDLLNLDAVFPLASAIFAGEREHGRQVWGRFSVSFLVDGDVDERWYRGGRGGVHKFRETN